MSDPWAPLRDPLNPFNDTGISDEDEAIMRYLLDAMAATGVEVRVTCTTDHPTGNTYHLKAGTNGRGLAVDCRGPKPGSYIHRAVFELFRPVERRLAELIYADPPAAIRSDGTWGPYNIKDGRRVRPYASADHTDHVHVAVPLDTMVRYPTQEDDMAMTPAQVDQMLATLNTIAANTETAKNAALESLDLLRSIDQRLAARPT